MQSLLISLLFPLLLILILLKKRKQPPSHLPPSPFKLPIIGNLHQLGRLPHRSLHALFLKHGPLMLLKLGLTTPTLVVSSADMARKIMKTHDLAFSSRPPALMAQRLMYGKDIAFAPYGEYWRQARRICVLHLLSSKQVELFRLVRKEEIALFTDGIRSSAAIKGVVNLSEAIISLTNNVTCRAALGKKYEVEGCGSGNDAKGIRRLTGEFLELLGAFHVADFFPRLGWISRFSGMDERVGRNFKEWDHLLTMILKDHESGKRENGDQSHEGVKDFVDVLLQVQKDGSAGISLTGDHIKAIIMDMFAAGTDTIYTALEWTMAELMRHPKAMEKLQQEVRGLASGQSMVTEDNLHHMNYLKSVIKESLRMHPPLPLLVPRESIEDVQIDGYHIPTNTRVMINAWAIGRDPKSWESPDEFLPERFISSGSCCHLDFKGHDYELVPFGAGRRGCPGIHFATAIIELGLANLVYHFDWETPSRGMSREDLDMTESSGITVHKKDILLLVAKPHYC
ncbi:hypothetical protein ACLOJK_009159 [Asimina triloba]